MSGFLSPIVIRRWTLAWIAVAALLTAALLVWGTAPRDPVFEGRALSLHLEAFSERGLSFGGVSQSDLAGMQVQPPRIELECSDPAAVRAIRAVGTNALPLLTGMLRSRDSAVLRGCRSLAEGRPWLQRILPLPPSASWARQIQALAAFRELGPAARPAVPGILPLLEDPDSGMVALVALLMVRPEREADVLAITNLLRISVTNRSETTPALIHASMFLGLSEFGSRSTGALSVARSGLHSPDDRVRGAAAIALARMGAPAGEVVPVILSNLVSIPIPAGLPEPARGRWSPRRLVAGMEADRNRLLHLWALGFYGAEAAPALPTLAALEGRLQGNAAAAVAQTIEQVRAAEGGASR